MKENRQIEVSPRALSKNHMVYKQFDIKLRYTYIIFFKVTGYRVGQGGPSGVVHSYRV